MNVNSTAVVNGAVVNGYSRKVSLIKAISWHILAGLDTALIAYFFTSSWVASINISILEVMTKTFLFYWHERGWNQISSALRHPIFIFGHGGQSNSFIKAFSWRICGTLDTILISFFITREVHTAILIGSVDLVTKIVLYYFHERARLKIVNYNNRVKKESDSVANAEKNELSKGLTV